MDSNYPGLLQAAALMLTVFDLHDGTCTALQLWLYYLQCQWLSVFIPITETVARAEPSTTSAGSCSITSSWRSAPAEHAMSSQACCPPPHTHPLQRRIQKLLRLFYGLTALLEDYLDTDRSPQCSDTVSYPEGTAANRDWLSFQFLLPGNEGDEVRAAMNYGAKSKTTTTELYGACITVNSGIPCPDR